PRRRRQRGVDPAAAAPPVAAEAAPVAADGPLLRLLEGAPARDGHAEQDGRARRRRGGDDRDDVLPYPPPARPEGTRRAPAPKLVAVPPRYSGQTLGARLRRHRVGWEPRPLTEDRRSDWEEVDGQRTLLINTRFPLYR